MNMVSLDFSVTYFFRPYHGPGVDSAPSENEYQVHFLGVKAAVAWGWQPHHLHVPNVMKSGSLNLLEPSEPLQACYGTALPLHFYYTWTGWHLAAWPGLDPRRMRVVFVVDSVSGTSVLPIS